MAAETRPHLIIGTTCHMRRDPQWTNSRNAPISDGFRTHGKGGEISPVVRFAFVHFLYAAERWVCLFSPRVCCRERKWATTRIFISTSNRRYDLKSTLPLTRAGMSLRNLQIRFSQKMGVFRTSSRSTLINDPFRK